MKQFLTKLRDDDPTAISQINDQAIPLTGEGPILFWIVHTGTFTDEDDMEKVIRFLGTIKGIYVNKKDHYNRSPLGEAITNINPKAVKVLLDIGADKGKKLSDQYPVYPVKGKGIAINTPIPLEYATYKNELETDTAKKAKYDEIIALLK